MRIGEVYVYGNYGTCITGQPPAPPRLATFVGLRAVVPMTSNTTTANDGGSGSRCLPFSGRCDSGGSTTQMKLEYGRDFSWCVTKQSLRPASNANVINNNNAVHNTNDDNSRNNTNQNYNNNIDTNTCNSDSNSSADTKEEVSIRSGMDCEVLLEFRNCVAISGTYYNSSTTAMASTDASTARIVARPVIFDIEPCGRESSFGDKNSSICNVSGSSNSAATSSGIYALRTSGRVKLPGDVYAIKSGLQCSEILMEYENGIYTQHCIGAAAEQRSTWSTY
eukprot:GHVS01063337.1.p1 GENE.GHVS01063337.1~~GHVS01063337.1.p1  ORF type:complete len:279 (+),score=38.71 GHVS01063337.1:1061-1897(+)